MDAPAATARGSATTRAAVVISAALAAVLHVPWALWFASGGDLAAQDFWSDAVTRFPSNAYDLSTYGGMHVATYSLLSPYVLGSIGVRPALAVAAVACVAMTAWLAARLVDLRWPWLPGCVAAVVITGNSVSGRATFAVGLLSALAAVLAAFGRRAPARRAALIGQAAVVAGCSGLATLGSPVAGLFLGFLAGAVWLAAAPPPASPGIGARIAGVLRQPLAHQRVLAYCLGIPPVAVVFGTAALFPFTGEQPMGWPSAILPTGVGVAVWLLAPSSWRIVRILAAAYAVAVVSVLLVPSPIGTNVTRLGLVFGAVVLAVIAARTPSAADGRSRLDQLPRRRELAAVGALGAFAWAVAVPITDVVRTAPDPAWERSSAELLAELFRIQAELTRIEVVPTASHLETSKLAPHMILARGWNRQADLARNPLFYGREPLTPASYREWLDRWAISLVVVAPGNVDAHAGEEADLVAGGLPYLAPVWEHPDGWTIYAVDDPAPLAGPHADIVALDSAHFTVAVTEPGDVTIRMLHSPWMIVDGGFGACVTVDADGWTVLRVSEPGLYTVRSPYRFDRGAPCPAP